MWSGNFHPFALTFSALFTLSLTTIKEDEGVDGFYTYRCFSSHCNPCLSITIRNNNEFVWQEWSPCGSEKIWGRWSLVEGKRADTLLIHSTQKIIFGNDQWDTLQIDNSFEKLKNEKWMIDKGRLYLTQDEKGKFDDYYLWRQ